MLRFGKPEKCMNRGFGFFIPLGHKTADDLAFGDTAKGKKKPTGRETPAEIAKGALESTRCAFSSAPFAISGQQQCFALLPSARLLQHSWFGTNPNTLPYPLPFSSCTWFYPHHYHWSAHVRTKKHVQVVLLTCTCEQSGTAKRFAGVQRASGPLAGCGAAPRPVCTTQQPFVLPEQKNRFTSLLYYAFLFSCFMI
jgi:hypothetical protein